MSLGRLLYLAAIAAAVAAVFRLAAFEGVYAASASMEPTLPVGTHALCDKLTFRFRPPRRGEIIVFLSPIPPHEGMIKRVIGLPGDTVELREKAVWVNGQPLEEPYARHSRQGERLAGDNLGPLVVPEGSFFVLGDNRDESNDSTAWKDPSTGQPVYFLPRTEVKGLLRGIF